MENSLAQLINIVVVVGAVMIGFTLYFCLYMFKRINDVFEFRKTIIDSTNNLEELGEFHKLPSFDSMVYKFWIPFETYTRQLSFKVKGY